ncbi:arsenic resistance protein ArsH [Hyaloraphidium curvatum]|nr:arsenic resistance protein ArsH [Hyaloraphidium curvatum]
MTGAAAQAAPGHPLVPAPPARILTPLPAFLAAMSEDELNARHRPYRILKNPDPAADWVAQLDLEQSTVTSLFPKIGQSNDTPLPPRILLLYGSLRPRSFSRLLCFEFARLLEKLGCDCRVYDPLGLPPHDVARDETHDKVLELRYLSEWSEGQVWVTPEQHGAITGLMKGQIDWIPLARGSVRPTQSRTLAVAEVSGGSQSFNAVNTLRLLGRWMRMITIPNQSSVPKAFTEFDDDDRMKKSELRGRVVDVAEELVKFTLLTRSHSALLVDRWSEREEKRENEGKLLTQAEKLAKAGTAVNGAKAEREG